MLCNLVRAVCRFTIFFACSPFVLACYELLERDIERVCRYFARYGIEADAQELAHDMWRRYLVSDL